MKILIAIDKFKECLSAIELTDIISAAVSDIYHDAEIIKKPIADGGEGFEEIIINNAGGKHIVCSAHFCTGELIDSQYGILTSDNTAIIEMAKTCALSKIPNSLRNPMNTSTFGMGEQILNAIKHNCNNIVIGLGGAGTHDMGLGLLQALGFAFYDYDGQLLENGGGAKQLTQIARIDDSKVASKIKKANYIIACDVDNPLLGAKGAAHTYAPQKGATPEMVEQLEKGAANFANVIKKHTDIDITRLKGGGAAGGVGAAMSALLGAKMQSGIDLVIKYSQLEQDLAQGIDLAITGEGKMDNQSLNGKVPFGVAKICAKYKVPVMAFCGRLENNCAELNKYFASINEISPKDMDLAQAIKNTPQNLAKMVKQVIIDWQKQS
ncbi:MAG: glycerate kinase [Alphaproteobacteria bacterium]|nr:glycerate kinase [Alphaproteobacteria bacterium]